MKRTALENVRRLAEGSVEEVYSLLSDYPWDKPRFYGSWLAQTYYFVRHATRLLTYAAARCPFDQEKFHMELLKGAAEESGHEALALNDLKQIGLSINDFPELPETSAYYQTLYYAIDHDGPAALAGYFLPLEGVAALKLGANHKQVKEAFHARAVSFMRVHCDQDVSHFSEGLQALDRFSEDQLKVVERAIHRSVPLYCAIIRAIHATEAARTPMRDVA